MSPTNETEENINLKLLKKIECPSCLDYMTGKILLCKTGHSMCVSCYKFLQDCPICKQPLSSSRNYNLEEIAEILKFPCTFLNCTKFIYLKDLEDHKQKCSYRKYPCLLKNHEAYCIWVGPRIDLLEHALNEHNEKAWMKMENLDRWTKGVDDNDEVQMAEAFDEVFYVFRKCLTTKGDPTKSVMYWGVQLIGNSEEAPNFQYEVLLSDDEKRVKFSMTHICQGDTSTFNNIIEKGQCIGIPMNILETFLNEEGTLSYYIRIESATEENDA